MPFSYNSNSSYYNYLSKLYNFCKSPQDEYIKTIP